MSKVDQFGFAPIILIVSVVILLAVGVGGYMVLTHMPQYGQQHPIYQGNHVAYGQGSNNGQNQNENQGQQGGNNLNWNSSALNEISEAENLPSCQGNAILNSPIADISTFAGIEPLGNVSSYNGNSQHVIPVDHMYVDFKRQGGSTSPQSPTLPATVLSPANIEIFQVSAVDYVKNGQVYNHDYTIYFASCKEVVFYYGHINTITKPIQDAMDAATDKTCPTPNVIDNVTYKSCTYGMTLKMNSGDKIGTAGGPDEKNTVSFDFGTYDSRGKPAAFIDMAYETPYNLHSVCGLDYYPDGAVKTSLYQKVENTVKNAQGFPDCGTNMQDKENTIQGNWYLPNAPKNGQVPNAQAIVFIHKNTNAKNGVVDWGGTIAPANRFEFTPSTSGLINREPSQVTADGNIYCYYDTVYGLSGKVLVQLTDSKTVKVEYQAGSCSASNNFKKPTTYIR